MDGQVNRQRSQEEQILGAIQPKDPPTKKEFPVSQKRLIPSHGEHGGPLVGVTAHYEDGSEKFYGHEYVRDSVEKKEEIVINPEPVLERHVVKCTEESCSQQVEFLHHEARISHETPLSLLRGWSFSTDKGWRCPEHSLEHEKTR